MGKEHLNVVSVPVILGSMAKNVSVMAQRAQVMNPSKLVSSKWNLIIVVSMGECNTILSAYTLDRHLG